MEIRLPSDVNAMAQRLANQLGSWKSASCRPESTASCHAGSLEPFPSRLSIGQRVLDLREPCMSPELSYGRHAGPASWDARRAAVQVLLYWNQGEWYLPLTLRPHHLARHAGQICLAGGVVEPGESERACAWREWCEELGEPGGTWQWVGELPETFVFASNFVVVPQVAVASQRPRFQLNAEEVAEVVELPVRALFQRELRGGHLERRGPLSFTAPHFHWQGHRIWGATALILEMLLRTLNHQGSAENSLSRNIVPPGASRYGSDMAGGIFKSGRGV